MCKQQNNIENLEGRLCALKAKFKASSVEHRYIILDASELSGLTPNNKTFYYGIVSTGDVTTSVLNLFGASFNVAADSQIIEMFEDIALTGVNAWFFGYEITVQGL